MNTMLVGKKVESGYHTVLPHSLALHSNLWQPNWTGGSLWGRGNCSSTLGWGWFSTHDNTKSDITFMIITLKYVIHEVVLTQPNNISFWDIVLGVHTVSMGVWEVPDTSQAARSRWKSTENCSFQPDSIRYPFGSCVFWHVLPRLCPFKLFLGTYWNVL